MKPAITCDPGCNPLSPSRYVAYPRRMKLLTKRAKVKAKDKLTYQDKRARQAQHKHEVREDARKPDQTPNDSAFRQRQSWPLTARGALPLAHGGPPGLSEQSLDHSGCSEPL